MPQYERNMQEQRGASSATTIRTFIRWLQLKKYQYEVTFSLYMLTPTERFIFNFIVFVLISMLVTAASLYLPSHIAIIYNRISYYVHGEYVSMMGSSQGVNVDGVIKSTAGFVQSMSPTSTRVRETAGKIIHKMGEL